MMPATDLKNDGSAQMDGAVPTQKIVSVNDPQPTA
jgi:hypothetical protein